ncbi:MAG: putative glucose/L-sorbosone dehydrogenase, distantly related to bacterial beta-galactosidase [Pedosphaera sp.]|nr:putative glucose/L-sorbosone dehydrogenase, distantly related to bacterial beta-galactosidase [Pedosphaera sp.]
MPSPNFQLKPGIKWNWSCWSVLLATAACFTSVGYSQPQKIGIYRDFALSHQGHAERGRFFFQNEPWLACTKCHTVDGSGGHAGPDLANIGEKLPKEELVRAVLEPSASIAVGYGTTIIETKDGEQYQGVIKQAGDTWVALMGADGKLTRFENSNIKQQRASTISLMPEGLQTTLSTQEFTDLIAYLESLRQPVMAAAVQRGMPASIPMAVKPATFKSFFADNIVFKAPLWFGEVPGHTNLYVVMEHPGMMWSVERTSAGDTKTVLLDLTNVVHFGPACGLLGLAFHPKFQENHRYFLKYQVELDGKVSTQVVERRLSPDGRRDLGESNLVISIPGATQDHVGGCIGFGLDGFLYIAMGDSGPQRDPQGHAQDLSRLLGKISRIDVDKTDGSQRYSIPKDNPFIGKPGVRPEIWAVGFREPWRFSFDPATGDLWVGDVGQDAFEEVDIVRAGENYGWNAYEGFTPFSNQYRRDDAKYVPPLFCYPHSTGVSITGGFVYHGKSAPQLQGHYICADFQVQKVWALTQTNRNLDGVFEIGRAPGRISYISEDSAGELYFVGYDSGLIYRADLSAVNINPQ